MKIDILGDKCCDNAAIATQWAEDYAELVEDPDITEVYEGELSCKGLVRSLPDRKDHRELRCPLYVRCPTVAITLAESGTARIVAQRPVEPPPLIGEPDRGYRVIETISAVQLLTDC